MTPDPVAEAKHSTATNREIAAHGLIFECVAGSNLTGTNLDNADDDRMGVCIEPPECVIGHASFEQYVGRSKPMGERSTEDDQDKVIYSLRKWAHLALGGNPTILQLLYVPDDKVISWGPDKVWWDEWMAKAYLFASRAAGRAFLGYMVQQRQRLMGVRGQKRIKRPELEEAHGYDTKYAGHIIRLGLQGVEYLQTGKLTLPLAEEDRARVLAVRRGEVEFNDVLTQAGELEKEIENLLEFSPLPAQPNRTHVNKLLVDIYVDFWTEKGWV